MITSRLIILCVLISTFVFQTSFASEIDSVTPRDLELDNSLVSINKIFNQRIQEGIQKANARLDDTDNLEGDEFCDEEILYTELRKAIFQSFTASWGFKGYALDQQLRSLLTSKSYSLALEDSIYRDISYIEGFSLNLKKLSDVVNINGHLIGLDKVVLFFGEGWQYFELTEKGNNIDQALSWGEEQEAGKFGYTTTGIFSSADLVANFNGWRFWNKVLNKDNDPLKGWFAALFNRPYVTCDIQVISSIKSRKTVKAWESNTRFDLADYIDGAWDEGNNCSSYADSNIEEKVTARIHNVNPNFNCSYVAGECVAAQKKYGAYAKEVLHPQCLNETN
ncbi:hypothetical protein [Desulfotalea psychrophila]|uniref:Uncharacterized protein n=1 Tax=Desulfotalea psychrophila (strain LSv54 / DSM 12343) TaxID=177439 RepID=Q6ALG4_DESPS|nr:hypothetical protein [Desulfotalea psychrophila]CAG36811.1 unknown protein [Desulfotalea psychrophila LSv54]